MVIVVGVTVILCCLILVIACCLRRKKRNPSNPEYEYNSYPLGDDDDGKTKRLSG
jgi:cbb3-type cytochrome oxidase subunit 3